MIKTIPTTHQATAEKNVSIYIIGSAMQYSEPPDTAHSCPRGTSNGCQINCYLKPSFAVTSGKQPLYCLAVPVVLDGRTIVRGHQIILLENEDGVNQVIYMSALSLHQTLLAQLVKGYIPSVLRLAARTYFNYG